jgi:hypothetical protein
MQYIDTNICAFLAWRWKQTRLPKHRASLKIRLWPNNKKEYNVSESFIIVRAV